MSQSENYMVIQKVLSGDVDAYGFFVSKYQKSIYNLMYRQTRLKEEAADLTQETFLKAYERLERFRPEGRFFSWLYAIGINLVRDWARKNRIATEKKDLLFTELASNDQAVESDELLDLKHNMEALLQALGSMPLEYREAIILRYREELSMKEIAEIFKLSVSGAKMRVHRGLEKLRKLLLENKHE